VKINFYQPNDRIKAIYKRVLAKVLNGDVRKKEKLFYTLREIFKISSVLCSLFLELIYENC